jgi:broad specificity phosphatase PhoE
VSTLPAPRLLLVRHGQSEWNAQGRWQGHADPPLTELGLAQARHASQHLRVPVRRIVSSDLVRAVQTAAVLAADRAVPPPEQRPDLRERSAGPWEGRTHDEIERDWPGYLASGRRPDGFEADEALLRRIVPALLLLAREAAVDVGRTPGADGDHVTLVVTHGGVLRALDRAHGCDEERFANLGGRWWEVRGEELVPGERLVLVDPDEVTRPEET